jgi:hemerythrin
MPYVAQDPASVVLGIPELDAEHAEQLRWMNRLGAAIDAGASPETIADDVETLVGYLEAHFLSEQIMMRENAYPGYGSHRAEHDEAVTILRDLQAKFAAGDTAALQELLQALSGWLVGHIRTADLALASFATAKGLPLP